MDESVVFNPQKNSEITKEQAVSSQPGSLQQQSLEVPPMLAEEESSSFMGNFSAFPLGAFIKGAIGIIFIILLIFLVLKVIIPSFSPQKSGTVKLTYWGLWEDKSVMQPIIADFEKENPNIKIEYIKEDPKQYKERLITRTKNGSGPDIFRFHNTWVSELSGILLPLPSDTIQKSDFQKWFYEFEQKDLIKKGAIYGIPLGIDTLSLFINTDIFQAASAVVPTTWDDFMNTARKLTVKAEDGKIKTAGAAMGTFDNITHAPDIISLLFVQNGVDIYNLSSTSQNASDTLDFYTSFTKGDGNVWDETLDPSLLSFAKGSLAMYLGYSWDIFTLKAMNSSLSFQIVTIPHLPNRPFTIASYWVEGVSIKSTHQKEALLFLKFLAKAETEQKLFTQAAKTRLFGEPYARVDLAESLKGNNLLYPFVAQAKQANSSFFASDTHDDGINSKMNSYLGNAVRSVLNNTSSQTAIETLSQGVDQVLGQYGQ